MFLSEKLKSAITAAGQEHVLRYFDELPEASQKKRADQLAEVEFDCYELAIHINIAQTRLQDKFLEFGGHTVTASLGAEVCEIYF